MKEQGQLLKMDRGMGMMGRLKVIRFGGVLVTKQYLVKDVLLNLMVLCFQISR
jgi:hypothetical protein